MRIRQIITVAALSLAASISISCTSFPASADTFNGMAMVTLTGQQEQNPSSKSVLSEGYRVNWTKGESISVVDDSGTIYEMQQSSISDDCGTATFTGELPSSTCRYAVSPVQKEVSIDGSTLTLNIPSSQDATAGTYAPDSNLAVADYGSKLSFHNVCGLLGITVNGSGVESLRLDATEKNGGALTGAAKVDCSVLPVVSSNLETGNGYVELIGGITSGTTYYAAVYPGTYSGLTLTMTDADGRTASFKSENTLTVTRSGATKISAFTVSDSDWQSGEGTTATLSYEELPTPSQYIKGYNNPTTYTNSFGTWEICAYNYGSAFQLNTNKVAYIGTPEFSGNITQVKITTSVDYSKNYCICSEKGTTTASGILQTAACTGTTTTIDVSGLNVKRFYLRSDACVRVKSMEITYGGAPSSDPDPDPYTPTPDPDPDAKADFGWFELPSQADKDANGIDDNNSDYYYSHTFRADAPAIRNFSCCYSKSKMQPVWVAAPMHSCYKGSSGRSEAYTSDPNISCTQTSKVTGYTRGHMLGSSDRTISNPTNRQVFYYSNIAAQLQTGFNTGGGAWNYMETFASGQMCADTLYQVIGCIFDTFQDKYGNTVDAKSVGSVQIPTAFYKALLRTKDGDSGKRVDQCTASELKCAAFIVGHCSNAGHKTSASDMYTIEELETLTGIKFFVNVPNAPKSTAKASEWGL